MTTKMLAGTPPLSIFDKSHFLALQQELLWGLSLQIRGVRGFSQPRVSRSWREPQPEALKLKMCRLCSSTPAQRTPNCYFWIPWFFRAAGNKSSCSWLPSNKERWITPAKTLPWTTQGLLQSWEPEVAEHRRIFLTQLQLHEAKSPQHRSRVRGVIMKPGWLICIELNHIQVTEQAPNLNCNMFPSRTQHVSGIQIEIAFFPPRNYPTQHKLLFFKRNNS